MCLISIRNSPKVITAGECRSISTLVLADRLVWLLVRLKNNIPQVGREEILKGREMHWLRLDRYFVDLSTILKQRSSLLCVSIATMLRAKVVCPVFATTHDPEGINSQTYNRCVGTRYCANACPYKVRRYNWWTHRWNEIEADPNTVTRARSTPTWSCAPAVSWKMCTFCVQRIRDAKHAVETTRAPLRDGEVKTACQQVCPSDAIVFGYLLNERSRVAQLRRDMRSYLMLNGDHEHKHYGLKILTNVSYMAEVTWKESAMHSGSHGTSAEHDQSPVETITVRKRTWNRFGPRQLKR